MATDPKPKTEEVAVPVDVFVGPNASLSVPVAGLLAHKPELRAKQLTETQWQRELAAYLKTPIDPVVDETE